MHENHSKFHQEDGSAQPGGDFDGIPILLTYFSKEEQNLLGVVLENRDKRVIWTIFVLLG